MHSSGRGIFPWGLVLTHRFDHDSTQWKDLHINHKETLAICLAATRWGHQWQNKRVIIHSDNQAAVQIINKGTTANDLIMYELRKLFWLSAHFNFHISAVYVPGEQNTLADSISRLHDPKHLLTFYSLLTQLFPQEIVTQTALLHYISAKSLQFLSFRCAGPNTGQAITS